MVLLAKKAFKAIRNSQSTTNNRTIKISYPRLLIWARLDFHWTRALNSSIQFLCFHLIKQWRTIKSKHNSTFNNFNMTLKKKKKMMINMKMKTKTCMKKKIKLISNQLSKSNIISNSRQFMKTKMMSLMKTAMQAKWMNTNLKRYHIKTM